MSKTGGAAVELSEPASPELVEVEVLDVLDEPSPVEVDPVPAGRVVTAVEKPVEVASEASPQAAKTKAARIGVRIAPQA